MIMIMMMMMIMMWKRFGNPNLGGGVGSPGVVMMMTVMMMLIMMMMMWKRFGKGVGWERRWLGKALARKGVGWECRWLGKAAATASLGAAAARARHKAAGTKC